MATSKLYRVGSGVTDPYSALANNIVAASGTMPSYKSFYTGGSYQAPKSTTVDSLPSTNTVSSLGGSMSSNLKPYTRTFSNTPENAARYGFTLPAQSSSSSALSSIIKQFETAAAEAKAANLARKQQVLDVYGQMEKMYSADTFGKSYLNELNASKVRDVGTSMQGDISRGLGGLINRGAEWESTVGVPSRAKLEDLRTSSLSNVLGQKASFLTGIEEEYPDYSTLANLIMAASNQG